MFGFRTVDDMPPRLPRSGRPGTHRSHGRRRPDDPVAQPPDRPDTVAEIAPGEGPEPGSVEYGGSEIHADGAGDRAPVRRPAAAGAVTTEAGTFEDLPVGEEDQGE